MLAALTFDPPAIRLTTITAPHPRPVNLTSSLNTLSQAPQRSSTISNIFQLESVPYPSSPLLFWIFFFVMCIHSLATE